MEWETLSPALREPVERRPECARAEPVLFGERTSSMLVPEAADPASGTSMLTS